MATKKGKKVKKGKKKVTSKKKRTKKAAASSRKEGFPTPKQMRKGRDEFAEEAGLRIITAAKVKDLAKAMGLRASGDFAEAVAKKVYMDIFKAAKRCVSNDRKTMRPDDL
jgi:hypothetical protein